MHSKVGRIIALIIKELMTLFRDPRSRFILIVPPLAQLLIFSFAATMDVKNVSVVILNLDNGKHGLKIAENIAASHSFAKVKFVSHLSEFKPEIDQQKAIAAIQIPQDFSRKLIANGSASIQVVLDGRRSNAAQTVNGYITQIVNTYANELAHEMGKVPRIPVMESRSWYNENLLYMWFTVPSLVVILSMIIALLVTSLSVARERELGTFDQLLVSPLMPHEILIGKTVPALLIGLVESLLIWAGGIFLFGVPFRGSFWLMLYALFAFELSIVGFGLFISSLSKTQQQGILGAFIFMVPVVTLSGFAAPVENMPVWLQQATWINPLKHALVVIKGLFLKDMGMVEVWANTWPLLVIGACTLAIAGWFFSHRLE